ncbi:hypothetical protein ABW20_dc0107134 [Dactylellina cionopaga]|nr:hypothetical protein ABW20_dc0107134 [Dactylellina cionopaga]
MVFALSGMKQHTTRKLAKHFDSSAIWESFPIMQSYYNGLYDLIPKSDNVPENTGPMNTPKATKPLARLLKRAKAAVKNNKKKNSKSKSKQKAKPKPKPKPLPPTIPYDPYPDYQSKAYKQSWPAGQHVDCSSLITNFTSSSSSQSTTMRVYRGTPKGLPDPFYGSYELLGIDNDICFERRMRLGMYGHKDRAEIPKNAKDEGVQYDLEWKGFDWKEVQEECVRMNQDRYESAEEVESRENMDEKRSIPDEPLGKRGKGLGKKHARTALVLRVWHSYEWKRLDYVNLRSLITELNVNSGGEYDVHLLMHVQDQSIPIWSKQEEYDRVVEESIVEEFRGMVTLWNEKMMLAWYPSLGVDWRELPMHGAYRSLWFPMQYFARKHPEYSHFWNLELDIKYTGHWYHFLEKITQFAKSQPRRGLWERNSRFYVPSVHGSYADFTTMVANEADPSESVWGPISVEGVNLTHHTPTPPFERPEDDKESTWGVGEEADLITLNPIFDPKNTTWGPRDDFTGYGRERPAESDVTRRDARRKHLHVAHDVQRDVASDSGATSRVESGVRPAPGLYG